LVTQILPNVPKEPREFEASALAADEATAAAAFRSLSKRGRHTKINMEGGRDVPSPPLLPTLLVDFTCLCFKSFSGGGNSGGGGFSGGDSGGTRFAFVTCRRDDGNNSLRDITSPRLSPRKKRLFCVFAASASVFALFSRFSRPHKSVSSSLL
jgi:hypothetical protein